MACWVLGKYRRTESMSEMAVCVQPPAFLKKKLERPLSNFFLVERGQLYKSKKMVDFLGWRALECQMLEVRLYLLERIFNGLAHISQD